MRRAAQVEVGGQVGAAHARGRARGGVRVAVVAHTVGRHVDGCRRLAHRDTDLASHGGVLLASRSEGHVLHGGASNRHHAWIGVSASRSRTRRDRQLAGGGGGIGRIANTAQRVGTFEGIGCCAAVVDSMSGVRPLSMIRSAPAARAVDQFAAATPEFLHNAVAPQGSARQ